MAKKARKITSAFERWMDKQRPWWRKWTDDEPAACTPVAVGQFMREAWDAAIDAAESSCVDGNCRRGGRGLRRRHQTHGEAVSDTPRTSTCNLDTGCKETGKCFALLNGDISRCGSFGPIDGNMQNTSLENWFPYSAEELMATKRENADLRKRLEINPEAPSYDGISCRDETIRLLDKQVADLRAKLAAAQRDAERYRWLRAAEVIPFNIMHIEYMGEVLDARIDAAKEERSEQLSADGLRISACSVDAVDREERDAQG